MTNMSVEFPSEVAQRAKLLLPVKYDPYQDKKNPRLCYFGFDQDHNALLLIADDTKDLLDIFYFNDMIGASVGVELHGSEEPRVSKGSTGLDPLVMEKVHDDNVPTSMVPSDTQAAAMLTLYSYPRKDPSKDSFISSCTGRQSSTQPITKFDVSNPSRKTSLLHRYACHHTFQLAPTEELDDISTVVKAIQNLARPASSSSNGEGGKDRLLLIVNPFSGRKKGLEIFQTIVIPMLDQAGIDYDSVITTHAGHAEEVMIPKDEDVVDGISDISKYTGLVAIGGDGSVYEVLQGIKKRPDSEQVLQSLSIGHIGAGTSNGLSATLAHACDEKFTATDNAFVVAKGNTVPMDLSRYETTSANYLSFLTFTWSLIADVDIDSEVLRWMGWSRIEVYTVWRVLNLRRYKGKITYLPSSAEKLQSLPPLSTELDKKDGWVTLDESFVLLWVSQVTHAGENIFNHPQSRPDDGLFHIFFIRGNVSRFRLLLILLSLETGTHVGMNGVEFIECTAYRFEPKSVGSYNDLDGEVIESGPIQGIVLPGATKAYCNVSSR